MPRSHIHRAPHDCSCPVLRRPCGALQKLEEFNRKASVRSIAGRRAAIMRASHG